MGSPPTASRRTRCLSDSSRDSTTRSASSSAERTACATSNTCDSRSSPARSPSSEMPQNHPLDFLKSLFKKLVIASNNPGKLREIGQILAPLGIEIIAQSVLAVPEAEEPYASFIENALAKARHAARLTGLPA